jgi:hypothetical protein
MMTYIPKMALQLQSFATVEEMNYHMNLHYLSFKSNLTKSNDVIFHLIKKYACKVAGVCWLKQESLANLAQVSVKTVERAMKFLKEKGVLKIYHTKRSNGLNGNCYYVLLPFQGELLMDDEEIVAVEEGNVGAVDCQQTYETSKLQDVQKEDKLFISSNKALENSVKTKKEEELINNGRVQSNIYHLFNSKHSVPTNTITADEYQELIDDLVESQFSEEVAIEITNRVLQICPKNKLQKVRIFYAKALTKFKKRLAYHQPVFSVVNYFVKLVEEAIQVTYKSVGATETKPISPANPRILEILGDKLIYG